MLICLKNGTIYDPANRRDGDVGDLWLQDGSVVAPPADPTTRADVVYDLTGTIVFPGGIDIHCHIAGPKVNTARKLLPELRRDASPWVATELLRSGTTGPMPSTFVTGYLYAGLGYTTAFDAAIPLLSARHAHEEFHDTPCLDKGCFLLAGNHHFVLEQIAAGNSHRLQSFLGWMLQAGLGYAIKLVNPGGVEIWKQTGGNAHGLDDRVGTFGVTPRQIVQQVSSAVDQLGLPHPVHIHANQLGMPGNWATTLATMQALEGRRGHLTHIQFHSYGGDPNDTLSMKSAVSPLADYVNSHPEITVDVGQVMFGQTVSMTGDGPLGYYLHKVMGGKWFSGDTECETGCGIVPVKYKRKSLVHALQWAIGLEWYLLVQNPWQVALSTDHPNGAAFLAYPQIMALLMERSRRQEWLKTLPVDLTNRSLLADLPREYSLYEIAIITRAAPARMLGLTRKGHLGIGADADIVVYQPQADLAQMFSLPRYVFKGGVLMVDGGEIRAVPQGATWHTSVNIDLDEASHIEEWVNQHYTVRCRNMVMDTEEVPQRETVFGTQQPG